MEFRCCAKDGSGAEDVARTYVFLRALADQNRLKILCILQGGPKCVCEIFPLIGISDKLVSHHLKKLKDVGVVTEKREGNFIRYNLDKKVIGEYKKLFVQVIK